MNTCCGRSATARPLPRSARLDYDRRTYVAGCPSKVPSRRHVRSMSTVSINAFRILVWTYYIIYLQTAETLGMEGNVTERRLSHSVTPQWLEPNQAGTVTQPGTVRDPSPNPLGRFSEQRLSIDDSKKLHIQTSATNASMGLFIESLLGLSYWFRFFFQLPRFNCSHCPDTVRPRRQISRMPKSKS